MALGQLRLKPSPRACGRGRVYGDCPYHCPQFACGGHTYTEVRGAKERVYTVSATNEQRLRCLTSALKSASLACVLRIDVWECAEDEARRRRSREPKTKGGLGSDLENHIAPKLHKRPLTATARRVRTYTALLESFRKGGSPPKSLLSSLLSDNAMRDGRLKTPRRARRVPVRRYERVGPCYVSLFSVLSLSAGCISLLLRDESSGGSGVYPPVPTGTVAALVFGIYGYRIFQ